MRRFWNVCFLLLATAACRIEPTPQQYIDRQSGLADMAAASQLELTERLGAVPAVAAGRDLDGLDELLSPHSTGVLLNGSSSGPTTLRRIGSEIDEIVAGRDLDPSRIEVTVGPQNSVAWFVAEYHPRPATGANERLLLSGVFRRLEGRWQLVQAHLSDSPGMEPDPRQLESAPR